MLLLTGWYGDREPVRDLISRQISNEQKANFQITEQSLENLKSEDLPDDILKNLDGLRGEGVRGEEKFLAILKDTIGEQPTVQYKSSILKHAKQNKPAVAYEFCKLSATVVSETKGEEPTQSEKKGQLRLDWKCDHQGDLRLPDHLPISQQITRPDEYRERELDARLCGFFQDRVEELFDEAARGRTLRDVIEPVPPVLRSIHEVLDRVKAVFQAATPDAQQYRTSITPEAHLSTLNAVYDRLMALYPQPVQEVDTWAQDADSSTGFETPAAVDEFAQTWLKDRRSRGLTLRQAFSKALRRSMADRLRVAEKAATGETAETQDLLQQIETVRHEIERIELRYPTLEQDLTLFSAEEPGLPDAQSIFRALGLYSQRWSQVLKTSEGAPDVRELQRVLDELAAVQEGEATKCADILGHWLDTRQQVAQTLRHLKDQLTQLDLLQEQSRTSRELRELRQLEGRLHTTLADFDRAWREVQEDETWHVNTENRRAAQSYLANACEALDWYKKQYERIVEPSLKLQIALQERVETILERFSFVEGFLPLNLVPNDKNDPTSGAEFRRYHILTDDGRELAHLSTGQRAQVAVSLLAAQNLAVTERLNHRIILLDDVTTAYDLSNLTREAILWRQLAYGSEDAKQSRQIFISSHHEDMTNHLLDLLVPPEGKRMRFIRFTGWQPDRGPLMTFYDVTPTGRVGSESANLQGLANTLKSF